MKIAAVHQNPLLRSLLARFKSKYSFVRSNAVKENFNYIITEELNLIKFKSPLIYIYIYKTVYIFV